MQNVVLKGQKIDTITTLEEGFASAVAGTMFRVEDIPIDTITIEIQRG